MQSYKLFAEPIDP